MVVCALGTSANPIIAQSTPGLKVNRWGYIEIDEKTGISSVPGIFAGGDIVTGSATVILAMGGAGLPAECCGTWACFRPAPAPEELKSNNRPIQESKVRKSTILYLQSAISSPYSTWPNHYIY